MGKVRFILSLLAIIPIVSLAQVQNGYVRTKGTSTNRTGSPLPQVQVFINGLNGAKISASNGTFNFNLGGGKTQYSVKSVIKQGYNLLNPLASSYNTGTARLELVMLSREEELNEKARIKKKIEQNITTGYERQMAALNKQKEDLEAQIATEKKKDATASAKIQKDIDALNDKIDALDNQYLKCNDLIEKLVNEYVRIDYATLNEQKAQLSAYIENGELEKADSLLQTIDIKSVLNDIKVLRADIKAHDKAIATQDSLYKKILSTAKMYWRGRYDIAVQNMQFDSAMYYVKQLAEVDTTNLDNVMECAAFMKIEKNYTEALHYCSVYSNSWKWTKDNTTSQLIQYGELVNMKATIYQLQNKYPDAIDCLTFAIDIFKKVYEKDTISAIIGLKDTYQGCADLMTIMGEFDKSEKFINKVLEFYTLLGDNNSEPVLSGLASALHSLSWLYSFQGRYKEAIQKITPAVKFYRNKAKDGTDVTKGTLALVLINLADMYENAQQYDKAKETALESLGILEGLIAKNPAKYNEGYMNILSSLMGICLAQKDYASVYRYGKPALRAIVELAKKEPHVYDFGLAKIHFNIGQANFEQQNWPEAEESLRKAANLFGDLSTVNGKLCQERYVHSLYLLAQTLFKEEKFDTSAECFEDVLFEATLLEEKEKKGFAPNKIYAEGMLSAILMFCSEFSEAEKYARETMHDDPSQTWVNINLLTSMLFQGKYDEAAELAKKIKDVPYKNSTMGKLAIQDIDEYDKRGIIPRQYKADVEKLRAVLKQ